MTIAPSGEQFELTLGDQRAVVTEVGAGLRAYSAGRRELVDGYAADELADSGRGQLLLPCPNRIRDGVYRFQAVDYRLPLNKPSVATRFTG
jgi:aldose 1-epimerase